MEQFKRAKVIMLPTDKESKLYINNSNRLVTILTSNINLTLKPIYQHLYIISDDEIKDDDWKYDDTFHKEITQVKNINSVSKYDKKIITTTDTSLTITIIPTGFKSGVGALSHSKQINLPQPSQQFIERYIESYNKGEVITDVLVEYESFTKAIDDFNNNHKLSWKLKINPKDNTIIIKESKDSWNREEVFTLLNTFNNAKVESPNIVKWIEENL